MKLTWHYYCEHRASNCFFCYGFTCAKHNAYLCYSSDARIDPLSVLAWRRLYEKDPDFLQWMALQY